MANKNILVSSDGKYTPISASADPSIGQLSSSIPVTLNSASFVGQNSLMQVYGGKLIPVATSSSISSGPYSGSVLTYNSSEGFAPSRTNGVSFNGDISGDTLSSIKVRSVSNVTGGVLPVTYGGTGTGSFSANSLVTTNGSGPSPSFANNIVISNVNSWQSISTNVLSTLVTNKTVAYLYTGSVGVSNTYIFTKPDKCRFIRVICQAGGGGGGAGFRGYNSSTDFGNGGGGGGGGGYSDIVFSAAGISNTVTVTAGAGGTGGILSSLAVAGSGGNSSFGNFIYSTGGAGGLSGDISGGASFGGVTNTGYPRSTGGAGGFGYTYFGGAGGYGAERAPSPGTGGISLFGSAGGSVAIGGAGGGGGGRLYTLYTDTGNAGGGLTSLNLAGGAVSAGTNLPPATPPSTSYLLINQVNTGIPNTSNTFLIDMPKLACSGGGGGGLFSNRLSVASNILASQGASPAFGSGGGGSGSGYYTGAEYGNGKNGGNGGVGYVLIICY